MKKNNHQKKIKKLQGRKNRVHFLKGLGQIILPKIYSFSRKGDNINLLCDGEEIHCFHKGVTVQSIKDYISSYKVLRDYCKASVSTCHQFENCNSCNSLHKKWAEERKYIGKKIVRPKPEEIEEREQTLIPIDSAIFSKRNYSGRWR